MASADFIAMKFQDVNQKTEKKLHLPSESKLMGEFRRHKNLKNNIKTDSKM